MAIELVIGYQGKDHVTAEQWADFNRGIFGDAAILPVGNRMETAIQTANQITVKDGVAVFDGREVYIGYGETENIAITSGTQGMLRRDIVVVEYTREEETGVESVQFKVINGTPAASNAQDPSVQDMDIRTGVFERNTGSKQCSRPFCTRYGYPDRCFCKPEAFLPCPPERNRNRRCGLPGTGKRI